jgi:uncharacterized membrane protein
MKSTTPICDLTAVARERLSGSWGKSIGVLATYLILLVGVSLLHFAGSLLQIIFSAPLTVGITMYFLATVRKQINPFSLLFAGFNCFGTSLCTYLLIILICLAWAVPFVLLAVPVFFFMKTSPLPTIIALEAVMFLSYALFMLILQMRYGLAFFVVADDPSLRARQAIRRSIELMKGNYGRLGLLWLRFVGWQLLCIVTFGIGLIWLAPYFLAATTAFYDDLIRNN